MADHSELALDSVRLLSEGRALLERLDDAVFVGTPAVRLGAVGSHFRHCLDFYLCRGGRLRGERTPTASGGRA